MEERRGKVRLSCLLRARYSPAGSQPFHEARVTDLSERGAGLLVRQSLRPGDHLQLDLELPSEETPLGMTGLVRWIQGDSSEVRWTSAGVEFINLDETQRYRLGTFLSEQLQKTLTRARLGHPVALATSPTTTAPWRRAATWLGALAILTAIVWMVVLQQENVRLGSVLKERNVMIAQLESHQYELTQALQETNTELTQTTAEVESLRQQTEMLESGLQQLGRDFETLQESYQRLSWERTQLLAQVEGLEQQRADVQRMLSNIPSLRKALHDAFRRRRDEQLAQRRLTIQALYNADYESLKRGNRGYLVRDGQPTTGSTLRIRVHDPQPASFSP